MTLNKIFSIAPREKIVKQVSTHFTVRLQNVSLFESADIIVEFYDDNQNRIDIVTMQIRGNDYENWGNNDQYIIDYVVKQLNLTLHNSNKEENVTEETKENVTEETM